MTISPSLSLQAQLPVTACNAGRFLSQGIGRHPERIIDSYELIFVNQGTLGMFEETVCFDLHARQTLLLWPGRRHGGTAVYSPDLQFYWLHFTLHEACPGECPEIAAIPQLQTISRPERLIQLLRWFLDAQEAGTLSPVSADLLVMQMLCEVSQAQVTAEDDVRPAALLAHRAHEYLRTHYRQPLSTLTIAEELDSNPDYLGRIYRSVYGMTLTEAIHRHRIRRACSLLLEGGLAITSVAQRCGFSDTGYFRRIFQRYAGMSPQAYRQLYARMHVNIE